MRSVRFYSTGCNRQAKFLVSMLPEAYFADKTPPVDDDGFEVEFDFDDDANPMVTTATGDPALTKVCAVDDAMGLWPRFAHAMYTGESFQE